MTRSQFENPERGAQGPALKLVYIAGPFSAPTREGVEANIRRAEALAIEVAKLGAMPVCPHTNTGHPDFEKVQDYEFWLDGTMELMSRCDAVIFAQGWEYSKGSVAEHEATGDLGLPVFTELRKLEEWLR